MVKIFVQRSFWDMSLELHPPLPQKKKKEKKKITTSQIVCHVHLLKLRSFQNDLFLKN